MAYGTAKNGDYQTTTLPWYQRNNQLVQQRVSSKNLVLPKKPALWMVWIVPSHSIGKWRFQCLLLNRRVPTHQNPIFDIEKHPILPKLSTFNNNLFSVHPVYVIWALSLLMKTHRSLYQISQTRHPNGKHVYVYQYHINVRPTPERGCSKKKNLMTHCRSSSEIWMIINMHEEFKKSHTLLYITYYSYYLLVDNFSMKPG